MIMSDHEWSLVIINDHSLLSNFCYGLVNLSLSYDSNLCVNHQA